MKIKVFANVNLESEEHMKEKVELGKLEGKDFIIVGIFGLLFAITQVIAGFATAITAVAFLFFAVLAAFPCGIIFMYVVAKVPKRGAISMIMLLSALLFFLIGTYGFWTPLFAAIGGIISDFIGGTGRYKRFWRNAIAFAVALTSIWFGFMQPMIFTTEQYIKNALESGVTLNQIQPMIDYISGNGFFIALIATIIAGVLGALLGRRVLRKHFEKAGVV